MIDTKNVVYTKTRTKPLPIQAPDEIPLDQIVEMSTVLMQRVIKGLSTDRRAELLAEIEIRIDMANSAACAPGRMYADDRGVTRFPSPYTMVKKYSYIYTCIAGWSSNKDLEAREEEIKERKIVERMEREGLTREEVEHLIWKEEMLESVEEGRKQGVWR